ncbi:hypothetical protein DFH06DRAFT_991310, partial [Mycena polygramma]
LIPIYGGFLAKESPIFHDMLQIPQPTDGEALDGCPVVSLPDNGRDMEFFLKALFDHQFFLPIPHPTTFDAVASILRLGRKYEVESLYKRALAHLASGFPLVKSDYPPSSLSWDPTGQYLRALLLAREMGIVWFLPIAFYRVCALYSIDDILNGVHIDVVRAELDPADKLVCLEQYVLLRGSASTEILDFLWDAAQIANCHDPRCTPVRIALRRQVEGWRSVHLPLTLWNDKYWDGHKVNVCDTCRTAMKAAHQTASDKFWDGLPQRFGVVGCDELRKMKEAGLGS